MWKTVAILTLTVALSGCGFLGGNVSREQGETTRAAIGKELSAPAGVTATAQGDVNIAMGDDAVERSQVRRTETMDAASAESAFKETKNPWTLLLLAGGLLALFLVNAYIAHKTGMDKVAKQARKALSDAIERATDEKTISALREAKDKANGG